MSQAKLTPSALFQPMIRDYLAEISDLGSDSKGGSKHALNTHIDERRTNFGAIAPISVKHPEMATAAFFGMKVPDDVGKHIILCCKKTLPKWSDISHRVAIPKGAQGIVSQAKDEFLVMAAGLEWARQNEGRISI